MLYRIQSKSMDVTALDMSAITIQLKNSLSLYFFSTLSFNLCVNEINAVKQAFPVVWLLELE